MACWIVAMQLCWVIATPQHSQPLELVALHGDARPLRMSSLAECPLNRDRLGLDVVNGLRRFRDRRISNGCLEVLRLSAFEIMGIKLRLPWQLHAGRRQSNDTMC